MNRWLKDCTLIGWVNDPLSSSPELPCFPLLGPTFPLSYCTSLVNWCQLPLLWAASLLNYGWGLLIYLFSEPPHASFLCVTYFFSELPLTSALFFESPVLWATPFEPFSESSPLSLSPSLSSSSATLLPCSAAYAANCACSQRSRVSSKLAAKDA